MIEQVADQFQPCEVREHGSVRIRCAACAHACLLALSRKRRDFCSNCHARHLAIWARWLDTTLLARCRTDRWWPPLQTNSPDPQVPLLGEVPLHPPELEGGDLDTMIPGSASRGADR